MDVNGHNIEIVWDRIKTHVGETFYQVRGGKFTYIVKGKHIELNRTNQNVPKSCFEEALKYVPLKDTVIVQHLRAPSYIYAILMDKRIREKDW